eukprot:GABV01007372.1.p2 GENE.GABV01007372.1~~GABV01007372.1.p2  ORF type:complete len:103 (+),score=37.26 GABV01007372.1:66-374(+)
MKFMQRGILKDRQEQLRLLKEFDEAEMIKIERIQKNSNNQTPPPPPPHPRPHNPQSLHQAEKQSHKPNPQHSPPTAPPNPPSFSQASLKPPASASAKAIAHA